MCQVKEIKEVYLTDLLQDLSMLALDQVFQDFYAAHTFSQTHHANILSYEKQVLGITMKLRGVGSSPNGIFLISYA